MRHSVTLPLFLLALLSCVRPSAAQQARANPRPPSPAGRWLVSGFESDAVHTYRVADGQPGRVLAGVDGAQCSLLGPDGDLYVCAEQVDQVLRFDGETLAPLGVFVGDDPLTPADENGPLNGPTGASFGPDGHLYVASFENDRILRFDGASGAYLGEFVSARLGGLDGPDAGTKWGPDDLLYVPSFWNDRILRYDTAGAFVDEFVSPGEASLRQPRDLVLHQGVWYVASSLNNRILRFDLAGNSLGQLTTVGRPYSLAFRPGSPDLHVVSLGGNNVRVFDTLTGADKGTLVASGSGGVLGAVWLTYLP